MNASGAVTQHGAWVWFTQNWWWVLLIVWVWGGAMVEGIRDFVVDTAQAVFTSKTKKELELRRMELKVERQRQRNLELEQAVNDKGRVLPGPCVHRRVVPVIPAGGDTPVAWLCKNCETRLPADWAVREEDL